jgi:hypothetical protein
VLSRLSQRFNIRPFATNADLAPESIECEGSVDLSCVYVSMVQVGCSCRR